MYILTNCGQWTPKIYKKDFPFTETGLFSSRPTTGEEDCPLGSAVQFELIFTGWQRVLRLPEAVPLEDPEAKGFTVRFSLEPEWKDWRVTHRYVSHAIKKRTDLKEKTHRLQKSAPKAKKNTRSSFCHM